MSVKKVPIFCVNFNVIFSFNINVNAITFDWPTDQVRRISLDDKAKVKAYSMENDKAGWLQKKLFKKASFSPSLASSLPAPPHGHDNSTCVCTVVSW